jgi:hypothetical protein
MSAPDIPLWKQELLKRKQAKLSHEKLVSSQKSNETSSKARVSNATSSNSSVLNSRLTDSENKPNFEIGKQNALDKNNSDSVYNTKKGGLHNRNMILEDSVDSSRTRQTSGKSNILDVDTGPSRLDDFGDKPGRNTGLYNKNFTISGSSNTYGMQANSRVPHRNAKESSKIVNDAVDKNRLQSSPVEVGVECEHIRPRDVKKMWQVQVKKDETTPKSHPTKKLTKENSRSPHSTGKVIPNQLNTQIGPNPASVPKAYKSPYAKTPWGRTPSVTDEKSVQTNTASHDVKNSDLKLHVVKPSSRIGGKTGDDPSENGDDGVEHIQSVKSLLGLFGGKARPNVNRKVSDNVVLGNKDHHTSDASSQNRPGLFKHHSEPNLHFNGDNKGGYFVPASPTRSLESPRKYPSSPRKSPTSPKKSPLSPQKSPSSPKKSPMGEVAVEDDVLPSHHVSHGIQERMSRLRTASHSNIEETDGFVEWQNEINSKPEKVLATKTNESPQKDFPVNTIHNNNQPQIPQPSTQGDTPVHQNGFTFGNDKSFSGTISFGNMTREDLFTSGTNTTQKHHIQRGSYPEKPPRLAHTEHNQQNSFNNVKETIVQNNEKSRLSSALDTNNRLSSPATSVPSAVIYHGGRTNKNTQNTIKDKKNELHDQNPPQKSSDKFPPEFGHRVTTKTESGSNLTGTNEHKSKNKYESTQSNYIVEVNQSESGVHNDVMSTECLTEIKQNKQDSKAVIKNQEIEVKSDAKPRRKGLNVVDPLAVLQLTKDPILLKEKPAADELGVLKESPTGKVQIIKHEPDRKNQIAQVNRAWDLDNHKQTSQQNNGDMPASSLHVSHGKPNVPVTSIDDEIPVSVIDDFASNKSKSNTNSGGVNVGNATFYNGTLSASGNVETPSTESGGEFIPVSSIDDEVDLGPPPEIVFDKMPGDLKSCFAAQNGKVLITVVFLFVTYSNLIVHI